MRRERVQTIVAIMLIVGIIAIDQVIKVAVKTGMYLHQAIHVTDWFYLLFTENNGMAFGWEFFDKLLLTTFRIIFVALIAFYVFRSIRKNIPWGYLICLSMIVAGAAGNIIDCVFYGMIFNNPPAPMVAEFVPYGTGYGTLLHGRVSSLVLSLTLPMLPSRVASWLCCSSIAIA